MSLAQKAIDRSSQPVDPARHKKRSASDIELAVAWLESRITTSAGAEVKRFNSNGAFVSWVAVTLREARRRGVL